MADVKNDDENNKLCATRRSAGIPFFVQVGMSGNIEIHNLHSNVDLYFNKIFVGINFHGFCETRSFKNPYKISGSEFPGIRERFKFLFIFCRPWSVLNLQAQVGHVLSGP